VIYSSLACVKKGYHLAGSAALRLVPVLLWVFNGLIKKVLILEETTITVVQMSVEQYSTITDALTWITVLLCFCVAFLFVLIISTSLRG